MLGEILGFLLGIVTTALLLKYVFKEKYPFLFEDEIVRLRQETTSLTQTMGGLEMLLGSKEKELAESHRQAQELQDLLEQEAQKNKNVISQKKSSEIRTGHIAEQLAPLLMTNHDPKNVRWLGQPIDYISFDNDFVTFIEVKSGKSHLSYNQKRIKHLILDKKVRWEEFRIRGRKNGDK